MDEAQTHPLIPIDDLAKRHYGLTESLAGTYREAARVCFDRHHESPVYVKVVRATDEKTAIASWEPTDDRTRGAWANRDDATRDGAYGCVIASVELMEGLYAVNRAETKTGSDYYIAPAGKTIEDLEDCWRLEVSGLDRGNEALVRRRLREKVQQARVGESNLPALAGVIGFEVLVVFLEYVIDK